MTAHKHAEMIKAKADDMDLVVFAENINTGEWWECSLDFPFNSQQNFFLCLPQHKEACLHWLNGGETEFECGGAWHSCETWSTSWSGLVCGFMQKDNVIRIKPRKEKRWIAVKGEVTSCLHDTRRELELMYANTSGVQFIEIEIEV